jgi:hypothetical protein
MPNLGKYSHITPATCHFSIKNNKKLNLKIKRKKKLKKKTKLHLQNSILQTIRALASIIIYTTSFWRRYRGIV